MVIIEARDYEKEPGYYQELTVDSVEYQLEQINLDVWILGQKLNKELELKHLMLETMKNMQRKLNYLLKKEVNKDGELNFPL